MSVRLGLNHICAPQLTVSELLTLSHKLGFTGIEVRNDLGPTGPFGDESIETIVTAARNLSQSIFSINALQTFDDASAASGLTTELRDLVSVAAKAGIPAIVMCPTNNAGDTRSSGRRYDDIVANLIAFAPVFEAAGVAGYIEPLGFGQCALRSARTAFQAISECGATCYAVLLDTFHHALGPDRPDDLSLYPVDKIGLIHVSWVSERLQLGEYTDEHRVLQREDDILGNVEQLKQLSASGYSGVVTFEPFSSEVHGMESDDLFEALKKSADIVREVCG